MKQNFKLDNLHYIPTKMNDEDYLMNRDLLVKIDDFKENKKSYNTRAEGKNFIKRDIIY
jgi:hypothetical protein